MFFNEYIFFERISIVLFYEISDSNKSCLVVQLRGCSHSHVAAEIGIEMLGKFSR